MPTSKGNGPKQPLDPKVVKTLLDKLSTDDAFRSLFERDAHAALVQAGWKAPDAPPAEGRMDAKALSGGTCLQLKDGATLASKEQIAAQRGKLEQSLSAIVNFFCPQELQAQ